MLKEYPPSLHYPCPRHPNGECISLTTIKLCKECVKQAFEYLFAPKKEQL